MGISHDFTICCLRPWQTRTQCCGHIVTDDVSWAAQTGKHLLRTQNVSEQNRKHFLCPGHKICVRNKYCKLRQTGKHSCRQQCVRNIVSSFAKAFSYLAYEGKRGWRSPYTSIQTRGLCFFSFITVCILYTSLPQSLCICNPAWEPNPQGFECDLTCWAHMHVH